MTVALSHIYIVGNYFKRGKKSEMQGARTRPLRANLMVEVLLDRGFRTPAGAMPAVVEGRIASHV